MASTGVQWSVQANAWRAKRKKHGFLFRSFFSDEGEAYSASFRMKRMLAHMPAAEVERIYNAGRSTELPLQPRYLTD